MANELNGLLSELSAVNVGTECDKWQFLTINLRGTRLCIFYTVEIIRNSIAIDKILQPVLWLYPLKGGFDKFIHTESDI